MNAPDPLTAPPAFAAQLRALSIRDLRADPSLAPGGGAFATVVSTFLPLVYGAALKLVAENPTSAGQIAAATFECFAIRWRRLSKKTLVGPWLLMAAKSVAVRERKRLRLRKAVRGSVQTEYLMLLNRIALLKSRVRDALVLQEILQVPTTDAAVALRMSSQRAAKYSAKGLARLRRRRKISLTHLLSAALVELNGTVPDEIAAPILERFSRWTRQAPRSDLTRLTLIGWRWLRLRVFFKRVLAGVGALVCILALLAGTVTYLVQNGYFTEFFIRMGDRQMAKEHPEMLLPARPWPVSEQDLVRVRSELPRTSAELYQSTNIWVAKLSFTEEQWEALQPTRVEPVRNLFRNGRIILRNPEAKRSGLSGALGY
jgi:hypothetical protein